MGVDSASLVPVRKPDEKDAGFPLPPDPAPIERKLEGLAAAVEEEAGLGGLLLWDDDSELLDREQELGGDAVRVRSEERRVGKECRL